MALIEDLVLSFVGIGFPPGRLRERPLHELPGDQPRLLQRSPKLPEGTHAWALSYWDALPPDEAEAYLSLKTGLHANIGETSAVLAVRPELVKLDRAVEGWPPFPELGGRRCRRSSPSSRRAPARVPRPSERRLGRPARLERRARRAFYEQIARAVGVVMDDVEAPADVGRQRAAAVSRAMSHPDRRKEPDVR